MNLKIESLLLLAKFDDGVVRQVLTDRTDQMSIINYLCYTHNAVRVQEGEVGIDWECKFNLTKND